MIKRLLHAAPWVPVGASVEVATVGTIPEVMKTVAAIKLQPTIGHVSPIQLPVMATGEMSEVGCVVISHVLLQNAIVRGGKLQLTDLSDPKLESLLSVFIFQPSSVEFTTVVFGKQQDLFSSCRAREVKQNKPP